ncbi:MAG: sodium-dependent transporter [Pseudomonadota bacterium]
MTDAPSIEAPTKEGREQFGSRLGFILAAAGSAVGIGNLVGFPVNAAKNGGGAFLLLYAVFVFLICVPVMVAELSVGRHTAKDPLGAYRGLGGGAPGWLLAGWLSVITPFFIGVFYAVITVWIMGYLVEAATGNLDQLADASRFTDFIQSPAVFGYLVVVGIIVFLIIAGGVKNGIERAAKIMMPTLFVILMLLVAFVLTLDNAFAGVAFYVVPDFAKLDAAVVSNALAQAFFSLSLGMGIMITYGSYMDAQSNLPGSARTVAIVDTGVAFSAGLLILPAVFSFNPDVDTAELSTSSVGLIFTFLPKIFLALQDTIGYGGASAVATVFFLLTFFAAITSLVSIIEVPTASLKEERSISRRRAISMIAGMTAVCTVAAAMSFGMVGALTEFVSYAGAPKSLFDVIYDMFYDTILPLNGLLICLFVIYRWKRANFDAEIERGNPHYKGTLLERYINFSLGTFIPLILFLVFVNTVALKYFGKAFVG